MNMRIGNGFDVHAFGEGDHVTLGGTRIAHARGLVAHSDSDVVIHALCDAIFGALALGDIGKHFPPSDQRWRHADSRQFLRHAASLMAQRGYALCNADVTVVCESPKIGPHAPAMVGNIAADTGLAETEVNIKAKTNEGLGYLGRKEGISATVVALLART